MKLRKQTKIVIAILGVVSSLMLSSCTTKALENEVKSSSVPSSSENSILKSIDMNDYEALAKEFLAPVSISNISSTAWYNVNDIPPDNLVIFYLAKNKLNNPDFYNIDIPSFNANEVESFIQDYFDVTVEYIRTSSYYNAETSMYKFVDLGNSENYKIIDASLNNRDLSISYEVYSPTDDTTVIRGGRLSIIILLNSYKYTANGSSEAYILNTNVNIDLNDYEALAKEFLMPASVSNISFITWDNVNDIPSDNLAIFYLAKKGYISNYNVNGHEVETLIQNYFDVAVEYIRTSSYYNAETSTYDFGGLGSPLLAEIIDAKLEDNKLLISYDIYSRDELSIIASSVLTIALSENSYKYVGCSIQRFD